MTPIKVSGFVLDYFDGYKSVSSHILQLCLGHFLPLKACQVILISSRTTKGTAQSLDTCTCPSALLSWIPPGQENLLSQFSSVDWCCSCITVHNWVFQPPSAAAAMCLQVVPALSRQVSTLFAEHDDSRAWTSTVCGKEGWSHILASLDVCQAALAVFLTVLISQHNSGCGITTCLALMVL